MNRKADFPRQETSAERLRRKIFARERPEGESPEQQSAATTLAVATGTAVRGFLERLVKLTMTEFKGLSMSFVLVCLVPTVLGTLYYGLIASDRYAAGASFVVRGIEAGPGNDIVSTFTGLASAGSTTSDSYVVRRYLESPDLVQTLDAEFDLRSAYGGWSIDPISHFNDDRPFEDLVDYWGRRMNTTYDSTTGIVSFEVQGFEPDFTYRLSQAVLAEVTRLINEISESARRDSVQFAQREVEGAEERLAAAQMALREFRSRQTSLDPTASVQLESQMLSGLETQLIELQARIQALAPTLGFGSSSPELALLRRQAEALESQIAQRRASGTVGATGPAGTARERERSLADMLSEYEVLQIEQTFAQQSYASAMSSLEAARMDADRQQRYLAVFSRPLMPQDSIYPYRLRNSVLVAIASFCAWAIGSLIVHAVRDHLS